MFLHSSERNNPPNLFNPLLILEFNHMKNLKKKKKIKQFPQSVYINKSFQNGAV